MRKFNVMVGQVAEILEMCSLRNNMFFNVKMECCVCFNTTL